MPAAFDVDTLSPPTHFTLARPAGPEPLPGAVWMQEPGCWAVAALPALVEPLRAFVLDTGARLSPAAEVLLAEIAELPRTARAIGCAAGGFDRPQVAFGLRTAAGARRLADALPGGATDDVPPRCVVALDSVSAGTIRRLHEERSIALTRATEAVLHELEQPSLLTAPRPEARPHTGDCPTTIVEGADGPQLRVCALCHPDRSAALGAVAAGATRTSDAWWVRLVPGETGSVRDAVAGVDGGVRAALDALVAEQAPLAELERLSSAHDDDLEVATLQGALRPFQRAAVRYALRARRTFLADEPGLGKTVQALATLEADGAFPALVVAPASMRLTWLREIERWLPAGREIEVVTYGTLHNHPGGAHLRALVLDESHLCKDPRAKRSQAAARIADGLGPDALVLLLTGTPVLNRPAEIAAQLALLGRLDELGGGSAFARFSDARRLGDLHRWLRQRCLVRRRKDEVLDQLPAKQRVVLPVELSSPQEYARVEADVIGWLREQAVADETFAREVERLPAAEREEAVRERERTAVQRARRAHALVRFAELKRVAALGKVEAATEWITTFLDSDEKLVVFCHHREVAARLLAAFPDAAHVLGSDSADAREADVRRFQEDPACRLIVCSLSAAGVGLTLTAASHVAFLELGWNPATHDQAEDRCHRIGQRRQVVAWYLLAEGTVDTMVARLIERKRAVVQAATDGGADEADAPTIDALTGWLLDAA